MDTLKDYVAFIGIAGAAFTFIVGVWKYISERKENHFWKEFEVYHKLVKELVQPENALPVKPGETQVAMYLDRQAAIVFELRNFKRYYPYLLYSVGVNGKDDGAKSYEDHKKPDDDWDDLVIRVPAPEQK